MSKYYARINQIQKEGCGCIHRIVNRAIAESWDSKTLHKEWRENRDKYCSKAPKYVYYFLDGYWECAVNTMMERYIGFYYIVGANIYSTKRDRADYYGKFFNEEKFCQARYPNGFFWNETKKPYFTE